MAAYTDTDLARIRQVSGRTAARAAQARVDIFQRHLNEYGRGTDD